MKIKILFSTILLIPMFLFSGFENSSFSLSYDVDSLRNVVLYLSVFMQEEDLVFQKNADSTYSSDISISVTMQRNDRSPLKSFEKDTVLKNDTYQKTKEKKYFEYTFSIPMIDEAEYASINLKDKNSSNSIQFETSLDAPKITADDSYIKSAYYLNDREKHFFSDDTIKLYVDYVFADSSSYFLNTFIQDKNAKVVYKNKKKLTPFKSDTISIFKDLYGGKYKLILELIKNNKKINVFYKDLNIDFSFSRSDKEFSEIMNALSYIAKWNEIDKMKKTEKDQRKNAWNDFWQKQEKYPEISGNISIYEFLERFEYSNANFSGFKKGYLTDFGRIYITYGKPDEIERHPFDTDSKPFEVWYYYSYNYEFYFVDENGYGEYNLKNYMEQLR